MRIASGANNAIREVGGAIGVASLAAVFSAQGGYESASRFVDGLAPALRVGAGAVAPADWWTGSMATPTSVPSFQQGRIPIRSSATPTSSGCRLQGGAAGHTVGRRGASAVISVAETADKAHAIEEPVLRTPLRCTHA